MTNISLEELVSTSTDGRPHPWLADGWSVSQDGLKLLVRLRRSVTFQDGKALDAETLRDILLKQMPGRIGPLFEDVGQIRIVSPTEIEFSLKRRSTLLLEALVDVPIEEPTVRSSGTGPFYSGPPTSGQIEMRANERYYLGRPSLDRIVIKSYSSSRSAWADMLRGRVDMLYDVGLDALDSLQPSSDVRVFAYQRHYVFLVLLNTNRPHLRDSHVRRLLNRAIDRRVLISEALNNRGIPADGPLWPYNWARDSQTQGFGYAPESVDKTSGRLHLTCLLVDPSQERLGLEIQRQLEAIGIDFSLELVPLDKLAARLNAGDFDAILADARSAPNLARPYVSWHSGSPFNFGHFSSPAVDAALDSIRHAPDDAAYKAGVAAFQRAIVDDPPAIFLAWSERARAVSRRFDVPAPEPGQDIWGTTLRLWRPTAEDRAASRN